jgi:hypothetical protein
MKVTALSFRQPWAELILRGVKTMDLRTWRVNNIGALAVHASQSVDHEACERFELDPEKLITGSVLGLVDIYSIFPLDKANYKKYSDKHLAQQTFEEPLYGWVLANPRRLKKPWPAKGQLKFFELEIPDRLFQDEIAKMVENDSQLQDTPFELFIMPDRTDECNLSYGFSLYQRQVEKPQQLRLQFAGAPGKGMIKIAELSSTALTLVSDDVLRALREAGYKAMEVNTSRRDPFCLPEEIGVRLGLLFLAVGPVSKISRVEAIARGIESMPSEEAYYWFSKSAHGPDAPRAQRALRILLSDES